MTLMLVGGDVARGSCGRHSEGWLAGWHGRAKGGASAQRRSLGGMGQGQRDGISEQDAETLCRLHVHVQPTG